MPRKAGRSNTKKAERNNVKKANKPSESSDRKTSENQNLYSPKPPEFFRDLESCPDPQDQLAISLENKRRQYLEFTREDKLLKLGSYASCQIPWCRCRGWKPPKDSLKVKDYKNVKCNLCHHTLVDHYSHIKNHPEDFLNYLLNFAVDLEAIYELFCVETDVVTKEVYRLLVGALQRGITDFVKPDLSKTMDIPPFEKISIPQALRLIIICKYSNFEDADLQNIIICAKILLQYIESLCLMKVNKWKKYFPDGNTSDYTLSYGRWLTYCHIPQVHKSFEHFNMLDIFGPKHLKLIYPYFKKIATYVSANEVMNEQVKDCCRRLIDVIEEELASESSVVWTTFEPSMVHPLIPDRLIPASYRALCPRLALVDCRTSADNIYSPDFCPGPLSPSDALLNGVPGDVVTEAIRNAMRHKRRTLNSTDGNIRHGEELSSVEVHIIANSVINNATAECLLYLKGLKDVLVRLLPELPKLLLTRYIFDTKHKSLVLVRHGKVVGGVCFRMFPEQNFSEIILLGVSQIKGISGFMINHLKDYHLKHNIHYFLSYVNDETVPFFKTQGFTTEITLDRKIFTKYLKEFSRVTLMECRLMPGVRYTALQDVTKIQLNIIKEMVRRRLHKLNQKLLEEAHLKNLKEANKVEEEKQSDIKCPMPISGHSETSENPMPVSGPSKTPEKCNDFNRQ